MSNKSDVINQPPHYKNHPSGIECITITEHFNFNKGNAIKYIWRAGDKDCEIQDLRKAAWYIEREIQRITTIEALQSLNQDHFPDVGNMIGTTTTKP